MFKFKKGKKKQFGPVITMIILTFIIILLSLIFSLFGITGTRTVIAGDSLETSLITVKNVLTKEGFTFMFTSIVDNFQNFRPLILLVISLIAISIGEASGLFKAVFRKFKRLNPKFLTFLVLLTGIFSSFFGEYSYIFLLPLVAVIYKEIGRKPLLGILTIFLGITIGYGTGLIFNNEAIILSHLSEQAARVDVDKNFTYSLTGNMSIMIVSTFIIAIVGTFIIHGVLDKKIPKSTYEETDELIYSRKGLLYSTIAFFVMLFAVVYMIVPRLPGSGILLGEGESYVERLFSDASPFYQGFTFIILWVMMICGCIYGYISGNIKNSTDYSVAMSKNFEGLGYVFVLLFFASQLIGLLEWTNLGTVIATIVVNFISSISLTGILLIIVFFISIVLMSILIPSAITKWEIVSPLLVPLMMRSNVTPTFTQFVFRAADSIGKSFTPFFAYYIITLAFLEKYNTKENTKITVFGTLHTILPTVLLFALLWLGILVIWYAVGLPTGIGMRPTF